MTPTSLAHRLLNGAQALALLIGMGLLLAWVGWFVAGTVGLGGFLAMGLAFLFVSPRFSPRLILRLYRARPLMSGEVPGLLRLVEALAVRAELTALPRLFYIASPVMNAFTVGRRANASLALTDGLLRNLTARELTGVLAHEIAHVRHNDIWIMGLADSASRLVWLGSLFGQALLIINLPLVLLDQVMLPWLPILILLAAPTLSALLQLGLSRNREFEADRVAAQLTGDPRGLALALDKLERYQRGLFERILLPGRREPQPSLLRTHPSSEERIRRLLELERDLAPEPAAAFALADWPEFFPADWPTITRPAARRWSGVWY
jgi:heat shock protein HtpX